VEVKTVSTGPRGRAIRGDLVLPAAVELRAAPLSSGGRTFSAFRALAWESAALVLASFLVYPRLSPMIGDLSVRSHNEGGIAVYNNFFSPNCQLL